MANDHSNKLLCLKLIDITYIRCLIKYKQSS